MILEVEHHEHYDVITSLEPAPRYGVVVLEDDPGGGAEEVAAELRELSNDDGDRHIKRKHAYTKGGFYIGNPETAAYLTDELGLRDLQVLPRPGRSKEEAKEQHIPVQIGFQPDEQKWYGWSHRAIYGFGIGYVAKKGSTTVSSGWSAEHLAAHPENDLSVPVGFVCQTLEDAKRCAIAHAESVS